MIGWIGSLGKKKKSLITYYCHRFLLQPAISAFSKAKMLWKKADIVMDVSGERDEVADGDYEREFCKIFGKGKRNLG